MKVKVSILIDKDVYQTAKKNGVNVSKACENYLRQLNEAISNLNTEKKTENESECGCRDLNPGRQRGSLTENGIDWPLFEDYVKKDHGERTARQLVSNAQRYKDSLLTRDFSAIQALSDTLRPNAMGALSALSKFLGIHEEFKTLVKQRGLKWSGKNADDIFIERLTKIQDPGEIWTWIKTAKEARPELKQFLDLLTVSGLRLSEGLNSFNLIIKLAKAGKLNEYYNQATSTLEHFRFKDMFVRKSKKAFFSFVPGELIQAIANSKPLVSSFGVQRRLAKKGLKLRFGDIREAHATFMNKYLKKEEIDVLHGRVTSSVFMQHYFNPALITDLRARSFQGIKEIQDKTK